MEGEKSVLHQDLLALLQQAEALKKANEDFRHKHGVINVSISCLSLGFFEDLRFLFPKEDITITLTSVDKFPIKMSSTFEGFELYSMHKMKEKPNINITEEDLYENISER